MKNVSDIVKDKIVGDLRYTVKVHQSTSFVFFLYVTSQNTIEQPIKKQINWTLDFHRPWQRAIA